MKNKKKQIILGMVAMIFITLLVISIYFFVTFTFKADAVITLGMNGFEPKNITITKGDTVEFKTTREAYFWPASNLHPTHELYAEFDPQVPVDPTENWSFTFKETGQWQYHDHLAPYYTGTITVTE